MDSSNWQLVNDMMLNARTDGTSLGSMLIGPYCQYLVSMRRAEVHPVNMSQEQMAKSFDSAQYVRCGELRRSWTFEVKG